MVIRLSGPLPDHVIEEALERIRREVVERGWLDEEQANRVVEVVREEVEATYGRDRHSQDA